MSTGPSLAAVSCPAHLLPTARPAQQVEDITILVLATHVLNSHTRLPWQHLPTKDQKDKVNLCKKSSGP